MRRTSFVLLVAAVITAGCNRQAQQPAPPTQTATPAAEMPNLSPPPPSAPASTAASQVGTPPPPPGADTAAAGAEVAVSEDEPLGGKGRPLTPDEVSLLNYGIYMFQQEKGRLPRDLNEAVATRYIIRLPQLPPGEKLNYDPKTGTVTVLKGK